MLNFCLLLDTFLKYNVGVIEDNNLEIKTQIQKMDKENNLLFLEVESKLDLLVKGQESNFIKLEGIGNDLRNSFIGLA